MISYYFIIFVILLIILIYVVVKIKNSPLKEQFDQNKTNIYSNTNLKPKLWIYWENIMPNYIKLCIETVYYHCDKSFDIFLVDNINIINFLPEFNYLIENIKLLPVQQRVDIYRLLLLYKFGGLYLDADIIVMKDLTEIVDKLKEYEYVGFGCTGEICKYGLGFPSNWAMATIPNSLLMKNCIKNITNKLFLNKNLFNNINKNNNYHGLGKEIIWEELNKLLKKNYRYYHYHSDYDGTRDSDGKWVNMDRIFSDKQIDYSHPNKQLFIVLYNSDMSENYKNKKSDEILNSNLNISKFIYKSLNKI